MGQQIYSGDFNFSEDEKLPGTDNSTPFVIVGEEAFRLHKNTMYCRSSARQDRAKTIFNYRLSHCRIVTENAFGLLAQIFRVFNTAIAIDVEVCDDLIIIACCLYNLLRDAFLEKGNTIYYEYDEGQTFEMGSLRSGGGFASANGFDVREKLNNFLFKKKLSCGKINKFLEHRQPILLLSTIKFNYLILSKNILCHFLK